MKRLFLLLTLLCGAFCCSAQNEWQDPDFFRNKGGELDSFLSRTRERMQYAREKASEYWKLARDNSVKKAKSSVQEAEGKARDMIQKIPGQSK